MTRTKYQNRIAILVAILVATVLLCGLTFSSPVAEALSHGGKEYSSFWYYDSLEIDDAKAAIANWDKTKLKPVTIAVVDTGIDTTHELFDGVLYLNAKGEIEGYNSRTGETVSAGALSDKSPNKHGNGVAGVIAMLVKELGLEDYIKIYPIKANSVNAQNADLATFSLKSIADAIRFSSEDLKADVVNLSLGMLTSDTGDWAIDQTLLHSINAAAEKTVIVAAAGNDGNNSGDGKKVFYPAAHDGVLGVMSLTKADKISSNYGDAYDICAPGSGIYTAKTASFNSYQEMEGSSVASPFVSVAAALLKLRNMAEDKESGAMTISRCIENLASRTVIDHGYTAKCLSLKSIVEQDFENTAVKYAVPTGLTLTHDGTLGTGDYKDAVCMHATKVKKLTFIAKINPYGKTDPALEETVQWKLKNGEDEISLGSGLKLEYFAKIYGDTVITATLKYGDKNLEVSQKLHIEYAPYLMGDVCVTFADKVQGGIGNVPHSGVLYTNTAMKFSLTGMEYVDQTVPIKWYVDGVEVGEGLEFVYVPKTAGKHIVAAKYGDKPKMIPPYAFEANVKAFILRPLDLSMLIIGIAIVVGVGIAVAIIVKKRKAVK